MDDPKAESKQNDRQVNCYPWRNYTWAIVGNAQDALWTAQVTLPSDW